MTTPTLCPVLAEPELRSLLLAAHHEPECDTIRGAIADWLEENAGTEECVHCAYDGCVQWGQKCGVCGGSHSVPDLSAQWSELIRVGVELRRHEADREASGKSGWRTLKLRSRVESLRAREPALRVAVELRLRRGAVCKTCEGHGRVNSDKPFRYTEDCPACLGTGWSGVLARLGDHAVSPVIQSLNHWFYPLHWQRGLPYRVDATLDEWWDSDQDQPSKFARRVVAWMPCLTELWVTDCESRSARGIPDSPLEGKDSFDWRDNEQWGGIGVLTTKLFKEVGKEAAYWSEENGFAEFATAGLARSALGRALRRLAVK